MDARERDIAVRAIAREGDPDRYAAALFVDPAARDALFALIALNVELARVAEQVREPQLGEIRLQWWRDALWRSFSGEATGHPVADAVAGAAGAFDLREDDIAGLIDARHYDVSVRRMPSDSALADYVDKTAGNLFGLAAKILSQKRDADVSESVARAAKAAGRAYGLTGLMRSLPVHLAHGRIDIPEDALRGHGLTADGVLAGQGSESLSALLGEWREQAKAALSGAKDEIARLPKEARSAFLPLALVEPYLAALEKSRDPLRTVATVNPLYRLWRLATYRFR